MTIRSFILQELVPPDIYQARGEAAWGLLDAGAVRTLQELRDRFGPLTVNNWHMGGQYKESGLRSLTTKTGAVLFSAPFWACIQQVNDWLAKAIGCPLYRNRVRVRR